MRRRLEAEDVGIADVQISHACAGRLDALGLDHDVADGVAERADTVCHRDCRARCTQRPRWLRNGHGATIQRIMLLVFRLVLALSAMSIGLQVATETPAP